MSRTGYIETKLKTLRKRLLVTEKAYKPREKKTKIDNEDHSDDETSSVTTSFGSEASTVDLRDAEEMKPVKEKVVLSFLSHLPCCFIYYFFFLSMFRSCGCKMLNQPQKRCL